MPAYHNDEIDLIAFLRVLWERKYVVIFITVLFGFTSIFIALTATPIFRADVVVTKVSDTNMSGAASLASQFGGLGRLAGFNLNHSGPGQEAQAVLESRHLTEEFIRRNDILEEILPVAGESQTLWKAVERFREIVLTIREDESEGSSVISTELVSSTCFLRYSILLSDCWRARVRISSLARAT